MRTKISKVLTGAVLLACFVLPAESASAAKTVSVNCNFFSPNPVSVAKGGKVVWNDKCGFHTVTAYVKNSKSWSKDVSLIPGQTTSRIFRTRGVFKYYCKNHGHLSASNVCSGMCGRVKVGL